MKNEFKIDNIVEIIDPQVAQIAKMISGRAFRIGKVIEFHLDPRFVKVRSNNPKCDPETADVWFSKDQLQMPHELE